MAHQKRITTAAAQLTSCLLVWFLMASPVLADGIAGAGLNIDIRNPLDGINSISDLVITILQIVITIAVPIIILFIVIAGFKYVTARGNAQQTQEANRALTYAIIGGILIIGAVALAEIIRNVVDAF